MHTGYFASREQEQYDDGRDRLSELKSVKRKLDMCEHFIKKLNENLLPNKDWVGQIVAAETMDHVKALSDQALTDLHSKMTQGR